MSTNSKIIFQVTSSTGSSSTHDQPSAATASMFIHSKVPIDRYTHAQIDLKVVYSIFSSLSLSRSLSSSLVLSLSHSFSHLLFLFLSRNRTLINVFFRCFFICYDLTLSVYIAQLDQRRKKKCRYRRKRRRWLNERSDVDTCGKELQKKIRSHITIGKCCNVLLHSLSVSSEPYTEGEK